MMVEEFRRDGADAWIVKLQAAGVPCGRINTVAQALDDPHTAACGMIETVEHATLGTLRMVRAPFNFSATPTSIRRAPPTLGQHTDEILRDALGMDAGKIAVLRRDKVI